MPTPSETVRAFLALWDKPGGLDQAFREYFTPATVWENVGWVTTVGPEEAIALKHKYDAQTGMAAIRVDNLAVAEIGNKVLTERVDHLLDRAGNVLFSPAVMGIFELENGKIVAWRDYFDTRSYVPPE
jgi:limonene-1,2-epoxide hydrolase